MQIWKLLLPLIVLLFCQLAVAETYLTEAEIMEVVIGKTLTGAADNKEWGEYYKPHWNNKPKGKIVGSWKGTEEKYKGKWFIKEDLLCIKFPVEGDDGCSYLALGENGKIYYFEEDGTPAGFAKIID